MGRAWKWAAVLAGTAAVLFWVLGVPVTGALPDWRSVAEFVVPVGSLATIAVLIVRDSAERGRSGGRWLAACVLLPPLAVPAFVVVAVYDRLRGRLGIESRWAPAGRWYLLASVVLAVVAPIPALSQIQVPSVSVSVPGASGTFSGSCSSALSVSLGTSSYGYPTYWPADTPPVLTAARATEAGRCSAVAADRMKASSICLGGALLLALVGQGINRRQNHRQQRQKLALP
ncbi:MAG TPA: hypothetical protein VF060_27585 [Trebonia sp.]